MSANDDRARYTAAAHAMQTGVKIVQEREYTDETFEGETSPKHLRVGVNSAMVDSAALAGLLIKKGIMTEDEYVEAVADGMEREAAAYERRVQQWLPGVKLR